ncbi:uncharacterized protein V6R79_018962 [Siganus canaliculatus]
MLSVWYSLLMLGVSRSSEIFERKIVSEGDNVALECEQYGNTFNNMFWIRVVSGRIPEVLGQTFKSTSVDPRIRVTIESGRFFLRITGAELNDTAVYFCLKTQPNVTFLKGAELRVQGDPVTLQCPLLSDSENITGHHSVCCCRSGSETSQTSLGLTEGNRVEKHEENSEGQSTKTCNYRPVRNISSSDSGSYHCAAFTCHDVSAGEESKPQTEDNVQNLQKDSVVLYLLCSALALSLMLIVFLSIIIHRLQKKNSCHSFTAAAADPQVNETGSDHQRHETEDDSLVYSAPNFTSRNSGKAEREEEAEIIYSNVGTLGPS